MRLLIFIACMMTLTFTAHAIGVDEDRLADPLLEARAYNIMKQLRCLVCQNESIAVSDAELAEDLRAIVRQKIKAGKSEREIINFMTSRYGDWVLLKPPLKPETVILWFGPLALVLIGGFMVFRFVRQRPETAIAEPLNADEEKRLKKILAEKDTRKNLLEKDQFGGGKS